MGLEEQRLPNFTVKNLIVTVASTISIVASVMGTYTALRSDIGEIKSQQETTNKVNEVRLNALEAQVGLLQKQVQQLTLSPRDPHKS